jgi:hypothetical protein
MSEFITNVLFNIFERLVLGEKPTFVEDVHLTIKMPENGWILGAIGEQVFAEYRGRNILFRPKFSVLHETDTLKDIHFIRQHTDHERVYITWREAASDNFFKDVEYLFRRVQKQESRAEGG